MSGSAAPSTAIADGRPSLATSEPPRPVAAAGVADAAPLPGVVRQLLRSAISLQAEDLLRNIGVLAQTPQDVREWTPLVERDVRDLALLVSVAVSAGGDLPAGLDGGTEDPHWPGSPIEGLLASHEALMNVLRQVADRCTDPRVCHAAGAVLERREEEATVLRALGAGRGVPRDAQLVRGALPKYNA